MIIPKYNVPVTTRAWNTAQRSLLNSIKKFEHWSSKIETWLRALGPRETNPRALHGIVVLVAASPEMADGCLLVMCPALHIQSFAVTRNSTFQQPILFHSLCLAVASPSFLETWPSPWSLPSQMKQTPTGVAAFSLMWIKQCYKPHIWEW